MSVNLLSDPYPLFSVKNNTSQKYLNLQGFFCDQDIIKIY